jgi:hypothetical protein
MKMDQMDDGVYRVKIVEAWIDRTEITFTMNGENGLLHTTVGLEWIDEDGLDGWVCDGAMQNFYRSCGVDYDDLCEHADEGELHKIPSVVGKEIVIIVRRGETGRLSRAIGGGTHVYYCRGDVDVGAELAKIDDNMAFWMWLDKQDWRGRNLGQMMDEWRGMQ